MKITDIRINGVQNPIGFCYDFLKCSWKVRDSYAKKQTYAKIEISLNDLFEPVLFVKEDSNLSSIGESLEYQMSPMTKYYIRVSIENELGEKAQGISNFETGKMNEPWLADWIGMNSEDKFHPLFFKNFDLKDQVQSARLYISGVGLYEAHINHTKVGNELLAPLYSDYSTEIQYQTYDVTQLLNKTNNQLEILLGNGWYKGRFGLDGKSEKFGSEFACIAELHIQYLNGESLLIKTDKSWKYKGSDVELSDIYDGEVLNRLLWDDKSNSEKEVQLMDLDKKKLVSRYSLPVIVKEVRYPAEILFTPAGEIVLDMGQNFAGLIQFENSFPRGTKITLDFGEILQDGNFFNENYRTAKSQFVYVSNGTGETVYPRFTYFGFRYVRVTGWVGKPELTDIKGLVVYSDLENTGNIETSNEQINRLFQNAMWGQKSNFIDFPTDCPQRDERMAWTGDAQVFAETATYNMDTRTFYNKFLHELRSEQVKYDGLVPNYFPVYEQPLACSVWGDVGTFMPMVLYRHYGDLDLLESYFPIMKDWVDYITREDQKRGQKYLFDFGFQYGDWLAQDGMSAQSFKGGTDDAFISSSYYFQSLKYVAEAASILGKDNLATQYLDLSEKVRESILNEYFTSTGRLSIDTQTGYLIALNFGIYRDKSKMIEALRERLFKDCYKLKGGFVGAPIMCRVMAENDMEEEALNILLSEEYPSWLYCVNLGATTIWERWNSVLADGKISGVQMNSLNHYAYGSVVEYLYKNLGGIAPLQPGFKKVRFSPQITGKFDYFTTHYDSVSGKYASEWRINADGSVYAKFEVPFSCTAELILPEHPEGTFHLDAGIHEFNYVPNNDLRKCFSMNTPVSQLIKNDQAYQALNDNLPFIMEYVSIDSDEVKALTLNSLNELTSSGVDQKDLDAAAEQILNIII